MPVHLSANIALPDSSPRFFTAKPSYRMLWSWRFVSLSHHKRRNDCGKISAVVKDSSFKWLLGSFRFIFFPFFFFFFFFKEIGKLAQVEEVERSNGDCLHQVIKMMSKLCNSAFTSFFFSKTTNVSSHRKIPLSSLHIFVVFLFFFYKCHVDSNAFFAHVSPTQSVRKVRLHIFLNCLATSAKGRKVKSLRLDSRRRNNNLAEIIYIMNNYRRFNWSIFPNVVFYHCVSKVVMHFSLLFGVAEKLFRGWIFLQIRIILSWIETIR